MTGLPAFSEVKKKIPGGKTGQKAFFYGIGDPTGGKGTTSAAELLRPEDPAPVVVPPVSPTPTPIFGRETDAAKKKTRRRAGRGRQQNILAGRMMSQRGDVLKTELG